MSRTRLRSLGRAFCLALLASSSLVCAGAIPATEVPSPPDPEVTPLVHEAPETEASLVFPPPEGDERHGRPPLPADLGGGDRGALLAVAEPELDAQGRFHFDGQTLRIVFNQPVVHRPDDDVDLRVTPAVAGKARWVDDRSVEFTAARPFDAEASYEVAVGGIRTASGEALAWRASFTSSPSVTLAGKVLGYVPRPGEQRVIAIHPGDGEHVGSAAHLSVLFDQPIELGLARGLVVLDDHRGQPISITVDHPHSPTFQGVKVDPRLVVLVRPLAPLRSGEDVLFLAHARKPIEADDTKVVKLTVADPLESTAVRCDYEYEDHGDACSFEKGRLHTRGRTVHVVFNNPIALDGKALAGHVTVTPKVANLGIRNEPWDHTVLLEGSFSSSTTYQISLAGLVDEYGNVQANPVHFQVETAPLGASVSMPEGLVLLDEAKSRRYAITTRNVAEAELRVWPVPPNDLDAFRTALGQARSHAVPDAPPALRIAVPINAQRDELVTTEVDLSATLAAGQSYLATVVTGKLAFGAAAMEFPPGSEAHEAPVALLNPGSPKTLAVHARAFAEATLVHVGRLATGEPVAGATVRMGDATSAAVTTDAQGMALLPGAPPEKEALLQVRTGGAEMVLPIGRDGVTAKQLFPDLASGEPIDPGGRRGMVVSDRGIYRPGSTLWIKANVRRPDGERLLALADAQVRLRVVGPMGSEEHAELATTTDLGSVATSFAIPADAKLGSYQILVEDPEHADPPLGRDIVQVAEFETPRFAVDVDPVEGDGAVQVFDPRPKGAPRKASATSGPHLRATVRGRYLFGAPMGGAIVKWTLRREPAPMPTGPLTDAGMLFRRANTWWDEGEEERADDDVWTRAGEAVLGADGTLKLDQVLQLSRAGGPQRFTLEADVTDTSLRHVAGRTSVVKHPAARYAGLRLTSPWVATGETITVPLGVIDLAGKPVVGATVTAQLTRSSFREVLRRGPGGALHAEWTDRRVEVERCTRKSALTPVDCQLHLGSSGDYEVTAEVDGHPGGSRWLYAFREGDDVKTPFPNRGRTLEITPDKPRYAPGERARLLVRNPYPAATVILTTEQGGLLDHQVRRVDGPAAVLEVPLTGADAPYVHATVTLLPIGAKGQAMTDYRIGAVRLPVSLKDARLEVALSTDKSTYLPGEEAEITALVQGGGKPDAHAEIALAVVDEGILRLTNFHAADPVTELRKGSALSFHIHDSRKGLADLYERSHVAGDGDGRGPAAVTVVSTRKDFVETALWRPDLRTDAAGRATVRFRLPDNLTEFRITAVVLDQDGKGAAAESSFTVRKPVLLVPVVPRFATAGDHFEAAAMLHNNTDLPFAATVSLGDRSTSVTVSPGGHSRIGFPVTAPAAGEMVLGFAVRDGSGKTHDRVEAKVRVEEPGLEERPMLSGAFAHEQEVSLVIPPDVRPSGKNAVSILVGQHLWPELGRRLEYLLGYPHGCVEQTTSSTLPLLAARAILPRIGFTALGDEELKTRIRAGLARLATMRTAGGGLAYWPGEEEPNVYGTAYAIRAVVLAKKAGVEPPKGLLEGMQEYLASQLLGRSIEPEVQAAIAESLGDLGVLPDSAADALFDGKEKQSVFGLASLALALDTLQGQGDRVSKLLDEVEASFDRSGNLTSPPKSNDFTYYGSPGRSRAQAAIALARLRRGSKLLPRLVSDLAGSTEAYTTQATAWSLLAIGEELTHTPADGQPTEVSLDGAPLAVTRDLGHGMREFSVPLASLRGKTAALHLSTSGDAAVGFSVSAAWTRPLAATDTLTGTSANDGPEVYRVFTDARGNRVDLAAIHAGDVVRVALLARLESHRWEERRGYLAITDRIPAGFEPIQPDLATVARVPDLGDEHPFAWLLRGSENSASHVELHDDRVNLYFDRFWGDEVAASYLVRASTPGEFALPPASGELMYEGNSTGYSDAGRVVIR